MGDRVFGILERIVRRYNSILILLASLMMSGLMGIVCLDLVLRYFFNAPLLWGTEITEIILLDITFLGMAWVFQEDGHVVIDVLVNKVRGKKKKVLQFIHYAVTGLVASVLIYYGFYATYDHFKRRVFNPTIMETPIWLIIIVIPIGSLPLFFEVLIKSWRSREKLG
mgnify:CR=1 FL=1